MTRNQWPRYASHDEASCFNCGGDFGPDPYWGSSGRPSGEGAFELACEKCRMTTYYDLWPPIDPTTGRPANFKREDGAWVTIAEGD